MKSLTGSELEALVLHWVRENKQASSDVEITRDTNLIEQGLLDSFGFIDLITFIESESGCRVDLVDVEPSEFCVVKGLCGIALRNGRGNHNDAISRKSDR